MELALRPKERGVNKTMLAFPSFVVVHRLDRVITGYEKSIPKTEMSIEAREIHNHLHAPAGFLPSFQRDSCD